jgi:hypothetical protein
MIVNGKFVKDWDKSKISTAYEYPLQTQIVSWDMEKLQSALLWGKPMKVTLKDRLNLFIRGRQ